MAPIDIAQLVQLRWTPNIELHALDRSQAAHHEQGCLQTSDATYFCISAK